MATERELTLIGRLKAGELPTDFNWNSEIDPHRLTEVPETIYSEPDNKRAQNTALVDEGLRDGLHGVPYYPGPHEMMKYIDQAASFGIQDMTVGIFPGEDDNKINKTTKRVLAEMYERYPNMNPIVLSLTTEASMNWAAECKEINPNLNAIVFMGTSPARLLVEEWTKEVVLNRLEWAVKFGSSEGIRIIGATEHTTQTPPDFLKEIITTQVQNGAEVFCIADTIGIARPKGVQRIVQFTRKVLDELGAHHVQIDWHGHRDTGNELQNAMTAIASGADRVHVVPGGVGERAGNTSLEAVVLNLSAIITESGHKPKWKLSELSKLIQTYYDITRIVHNEHGVLSERAFTSSLGIHSAARKKAESLVQVAQELNETDLAERLKRMSRTIYTAIDPNTIGRKHETKVSHWSGKSTVYLSLEEIALNGYPIDPATVPIYKIDAAIEMAKVLGRELTREELLKVVNGN